MQDIFASDSNHAVLPNRMEVESKLSRAIQLFKQGQFADARRLIGELPDDCRIPPDIAVALAEHSRLNGDFKDAERLYVLALKAVPGHAEAFRALGNLGIEAIELGRFEIAIGIFHALLQIDSKCAKAHFHFANALDKAGRPQEACRHYECAVALSPDFDDARVQLCFALIASGRGAEAAENIPILIRGNVEMGVIGNLGIQFRRAKLLEAAAHCFEHCVRQAPDHPQALVDWGLCLLTQERLQEARPILEKAVDLAPNLPEARANLGSLYSRMELKAEAISQFEAAVAAKPDYVDAIINLGNLKVLTGQDESAERLFERAILLDGQALQAYEGLSYAYLGLRRFEEAEATVRKILEIEPLSPKAHWNMAMIQLANGDFVQGLAGYEKWRWTNKDLKLVKPVVPSPELKSIGQARGRSLLIIEDQGLGDTLQCLRYIPLLQQCGVVVHVVIRPTLVPLVLPLVGAAGLHLSGAPSPMVDYHTFMMSLPYLFGTRLGTIPAATPYLHAPAEKMSSWWQRLGAPRNGARIGLAWSGNPEHANDHNRSMSLSDLMPLLQSDGVEFICLQREIRERDRALLADANIRAFCEDLNDFGDTAALAAQMDLIISVDTSVAHLAGALGLPMWLLLPFSAEWRWLRDRSDSPWYPTARLFRQKKPSDWGGLVAEVAEEMRRCFIDAGAHKTG